MKPKYFANNYIFHVKVNKFIIYWMLGLFAHGDLSQWYEK